MKSVRILLVASLATALGACVPKRETPPPPAQQPQATPRPRPAPPPPPPAPADWRDVAPTPCGWVYSSQGGISQALFGPADSEARFIVRCDRGRRQVSLWREGAAAGNMMTVRTSYGARNFPLSVQAEPMAYVYTSLPASDRILDQIAFSRGRFTVEVPGQPMLVLPAWPEPARVVEDCRA
jgi:hypothetical protein